MLLYYCILLYYNEHLRVKLRLIAFYVMLLYFNVLQACYTLPVCICVDSPQQVPGTSVYTLNGHGYAAQNITIFNYRAADRFKIMLEFKTFWDNSRLLFAGKPQVRPVVINPGSAP